MNVASDFGKKVIQELELEKIPIVRAELLKNHGNKIVAFQWDLDREMMLKDLLCYLTAGVFKSNVELAEELSKAYRRYKYEKF